MAQTAIATGIETKGRDLVRQGGQDMVEHTLRRMDESVKKSTGVSLFHILTIGSIAASIALYVSGKKSLGIFVGLWPPTFEALKAVADKRERDFE